MHNPPAWQVIGEVPPCCPASSEAMHLDPRRLSLLLILPGSRTELLELQFQLIDEPLAALGARTKHLPLHLGDHQLQVLDQCLGTNELGARLDQCRPQRKGVVGQMISALDHARDSSTIALIRVRPESKSRSFIHRQLSRPPQGAMCAADFSNRYRPACKPAAPH